MDLLEIEENQSLTFNTEFLNNIRSLILVFDKLLPKAYFIMLPGDEIVEKKHANIKILTAQMENSNLSRKPMKKWPGLGPNPFIVDYAELFDNYKDFKQEMTGKDTPAAAPTNEKAPPAGKGAAAQKVEQLSETALLNSQN